MALSILPDIAIATIHLMLRNQHSMLPAAKQIAAFLRPRVRWENQSVIVSM